MPDDQKKDELPVFEMLADGRTLRLFKPWHVDTASWKGTIPAGFETNLASVPRIFWWLIAPYGKFSMAAVAHDYLYSLRSMSRARADDVFRELMVELGVSWWVRRIMFIAVRAFGWSAWKRQVVEIKTTGEAAKGKIEAEVKATVKAGKAAEKRVEAEIKEAVEAVPKPKDES